jgi:hypothetical protein
MIKLITLFTFASIVLAVPANSNFYDNSIEYNPEERGFVGNVLELLLGTDPESAVGSDGQLHVRTGHSAQFLPQYPGPYSYPYIYGH